MDLHLTLNLVDRLILTKEILQGIPTYLMSLFPAPKGILMKIITIQRNFIWRGAEDIKKWALVSWEKMCWTKRKGGLGIQDPQVTNASYREKLCSRWVKYNLILWASMWKEKYAPGRNPQEIIRFTCRREGSSIWTLAWMNKKWI
jgi:hypothetical protein